MALPSKRVTESMNVSESRKQYSELLNRVHRDEQQIIIEKNGIPVAAIVPMSVVRDAELAEQNRKAAINAFHKVQNTFADIPEDELERELSKALAEAKEIQLRKHEAVERARSGQ